MSPTRYRVAEAAREAGVAPSTLRLWETQGLIEPARSASGQRSYSAADVERLRHIAWLRRDRGLNPAAIREALLAESADPAAAPAMTDSALGPRLRALRHARGETLDSVAAAVGVTASALSTLERTGQGVSFATLHALVRHYGSTVSQVSGQEDGSAAVVRATARREWPLSVAGVRVEILAEGRRQMDCHRFILSPGAASEGAYGHEGEEFIHVLQGRLRMILDGTEIHELYPGDSLYFESRRNHAWANADPGETVLIWVNTPPSF